MERRLRDETRVQVIHSQVVIGRRLLSVAFSLGLGVASAVPAAAQPDSPEAEPSAPAEERAGAETAGARALFERGLQHAQRREFQKAAEMFRAARALHRSPAIDYNLAAALVELAEYTEAALLVDEVLAAVDAPPAVVGPAGELRRSIEKQTGTLRVMAGEDMSGLSLRVGQVEVPWGRIGTPIAVTPGAHRVVLLRDDGAEAVRDVEVQAGEAETLVVELAPRAGDVAAQAHPEDPASADLASGATEVDRQPTSPFSDWRLWAAAGGGVAAVATVVVVVALLSSGDPVDGDVDPGVITWR